MVRFDITSTPKNAVIQSATLDLTIYGETIGNFEMYRISKKWVATEATWKKATSAINWNTPGGDCFTPAESSFVATGKPFFVKGNVMKFNVTKAVKEFYADPTKNFGWLLRTQESTASLGGSVNMAFYATNWDGFESSYPKLVVNYTTSTVATQTPVAAPAQKILSNLVLNGSALHLPISQESYRVTISSLNGTRILTQESKGGQVIDLSARSAGVYLVRIDAAGVSSTQPITLSSR